MGLLNVGIIGCGNFGGQVASSAVKEDFAAMAFNASKRDLDTLDDKVIPFIIGDSKGTGKSREYGKEFLLNHISVINDDQVVQFINSNDVIIVAGAAGGGFGSATVPTLLELFLEIYGDSKLFIALTTFPDLDESYTAQNHTEEFMRELLEVNVPYIIYDNDNYKNLSPAKMNEAIISTAVSDMKVLRGDYIVPTTSGGIDERDLMTAISTPGHMVINLINDVDESMIESGIVNRIKSEIDKSAHIKLVDDKLIMASAVMYNLSSDCAKHTPTVKHDMQAVFGEHVADYRNEAMKDPDDEDSDFIATIIAGLSCPTTRIDKVIARRQQIEKAINTRVAASTKLNDVASGELKLSTKQIGSSNASSKSNTDDILKKFASRKKGINNN